MLAKKTISRLLSALLIIMLLLTFIEPASAARALPEAPTVTPSIQFVRDTNPTETPIPTETPPTTETPTPSETPVAEATLTPTETAFATGTPTPAPADTSLPTDSLTPTETSLPTDVPPSGALITSDSANGDVTILSGATWYVATTGNDSNSCSVIGSPCLTINGAIGKSVDGDTIKVAIGTYTGSGPEGSPVVLINKSVTLSGGWNATFTTQNGMSTIDGEYTPQGTGVSVSGTAIIEFFIIQKGSGAGILNSGALTLNNSMITNNTGTGIWTGGTLTVNNSIISSNTSSDKGGGVYKSGGTLTLNSSIIKDNISSSYGGGIFNQDGALTLNNSTVIGNIANNSTGINGGGGIFHSLGSTLTINNSTISGNTALNAGGGGILNTGTLIINNTTISNNKAKTGGGLNMNSGSAALKNTIIAGNIADSAPDCSGTVGSAGYNLISNTSDCTFTSSIGDQLNVNPQLGTYPIGSPSYFVLLTGSPAINAGNPATCLTTDQRGVTRPQGSACDIGAYEYKTPGSAATFGISMGDNQKAAPLFAFAFPLVIYVVDSSGSPVSGVTVTFTAPGSGVSGTFANTGTNVTTASTNNSGVAVASAFTANSQSGNYDITATASGLAGSVSFTLANAAWYVDPTGNDSNTCASPVAPCLTINGAINKAVNGDTIKVATGTYTGSGTEVVLISKSLIVSGGWNSAFTMQGDVSTIDGQASRRGITVNSSITASIERFKVKNGSVSDGAGILNSGNLTINSSSISGNATVGQGSGIKNIGTLILNDSSVNGNTAGWHSGGIYNSGTATINRSTISNNSASMAGGIWNEAGVLNLNNTTISNNTSTGNGGGLQNSSNGTVNINNSTISGNIAMGDEGGGVRNYAIMKLQNTIIANNAGSGIGPDCIGNISITSLGYNLIGNNSNCNFTAATGDLVGTAASPINPGLTPLQENGGPTLTQGLIYGSPAINAGNPASPGSGGSACLATDQRGTTRPVDNRCDIGAFEGQVSGLQDSSFEAFTPNPYWSESSTNFGTPLCTVAICEDGGGTAGPHSGFAWGWFGGAPVNETATLSQSAVFPSSQAKLQFYFWIGAAAPGSNTADVFTAKIDGVTVFSANATQKNLYPAYTLVTVDVSAFADGASHTIKFTSVTTGQVVTFNLDDVTLFEPIYYAISGDAGIAGATLSYVDGTPKTAVADGSGLYSLDVPLGWSGTVTPSKFGYNFTPVNKIYTNVTADQTLQNYTAVYDVTPPTVSSITRANDNPSAATSISFLVTFSESVTGVETNDFTLTTTGVMGASISGISGSGITRLVTVKTGSGDGTIRLNLVDDNTIVDWVSNPLGGAGAGNGSFSSGEVYTIDKPNLPAPALRSPRTDAVTNDSTPTFWWTNVTGGGTYEIMFATDSAFTNNVNSKMTAGTSYTAAPAFGDGQYYWRVRAYNASNQFGTWSLSRTFTIDTTGPAVPALSSPANGASTRTPTFKWLSVPGAVLYEFQYDNNIAFSSPTKYTVTVRGTFRKPPAMPKGTYYWHVRAKDAAGNWSGWTVVPYMIQITGP